MAWPEGQFVIVHNGEIYNFSDQAALWSETIGWWILCDKHFLWFDKSEDRR